MSNIINSIKRHIYGVDEHDLVRIIPAVLENLFYDDLPSISFIKEHSLDEERLISRKEKKDIIADNRVATLYEINIEIMTFKILRYMENNSKEDFVEIYYEDDLIVNIKGKYEWVSFEDLGIDDGDMFWKYRKPELINCEQWKQRIHLLHLCQKEEIAQKKKIKKTINNDYELSKKKFSDINISDNNGT